MILHNNVSERVPQGLCSTVQHTPSSSVQTACRETESLGNAHTRQQTALKNGKHVLFITHQRPEIEFGFFIFWVTMAEMIWCISTRQQSEHSRICCGQEGPGHRRVHLSRRRQLDHTLSEPSCLGDQRERSNTLLRVPSSDVWPNCTPVGTSSTVPSSFLSR